MKVTTTTNYAKNDLLLRYLFEKQAVRGEVVRLQQSYQRILDNHDYPPVIQQLLGQMAVMATLLTATLKFDGDITLQLQGDGPVSMVVINGNATQQIRGVARYESHLVTTNQPLVELFPKGHLVITLKPKQGEPYQGIIAIEHDTLVGCVEEYFRRSEQLNTRLHIVTGEVAGQPVATGLLLQQLPDMPSEADFEHLAVLTATASETEMLTLPFEELLWRLYHQDAPLMLAQQPVTFQCFCSRERCIAALNTLSVEERMEILQADGEISMSCDYCGASYHFNESDFSENEVDERSHPLH